MKLASWNVNGLRACITKGFMDFLVDVDADVFCVQETKMEEGQSDVDLTLGGKYRVYFNSAEKKGYSGTAVFTKEEPSGVRYGIGMEGHDREGRVITLEYKGFYVVNIYAPNSKSELSRLDYRMAWEDDIREYLIGLDKDRPVVICGDLNVAHNDIDLKNPKTNRRSAGFTDEERGKLTTLLEAGFVDTYRYRYPDKAGAYTWWSYIGKARERNTGWRIDYFIVSESIREMIGEAYIYTDILGSDHCPVGLDLKY